MMQRQRVREQTDLATLSSSVAAMKNSIRIAVSTIAFQRGLFPTNTFRPKEYCGTSLMLLNPNQASDDHGASSPKGVAATQFCTYLEKGVFDAFDKRFVDRIMFNIHCGDPEKQDANTILESYSFRMDYENDLCEMEQRKGGKGVSRKNYRRSSRKQVADQTRNMIRRLSSTVSGLSELPEKVWITIYLTYNERAPQNYEPPHFVQTTLDSVPLFKSDPTSFQVSTTDTGYHQMAVKIRISEKQDCEMEEATQCVEETQKMKEKVMDGWDACKELVYDYLKTAVENDPTQCPEELIRNSEWQNSFSPSLLLDFKKRLIREGIISEPAAPNPALAPLAERCLSERTHFESEIMQCSQNSFEAERENISKLSKSKRPVECRTSVKRRRKN